VHFSGAGGLRLVARRGHADYLLAEAHTLLHLPDGLTYTDGALVACGFGTAYQGMLRAGVSGRDTVLVVGLGPVGLGPSCWPPRAAPR
jgi:D-arabinose 1-dehydrogenase-like Zn-dependent alcohol dehydrogenase